MSDLFLVSLGLALDLLQELFSPLSFIHLLHHHLLLSGLRLNTQIFDQNRAVDPSRLIFLNLLLQIVFHSLPCYGILAIVCGIVCRLTAPRILTSD